MPLWQMVLIVGVTSGALGCGSNGAGRGGGGAQGGSGPTGGSSGSGGATGGSLGGTGGGSRPTGGSSGSGGATGGGLGGTGGGGGPTGGSSGSGGATGGSLGGTGGGGGPVTCTGCGPNQVCLSGVCTDVPAQCPCPRESYCDLSKGSCVLGCTQDSDCATGRVCNSTTRTCFDGCHQDTVCGAGRICDDTTMSCRAGCRVKADCSGGLACIGTKCLAGCATTADCTSTGETCVNNACTCPSGQAACSGKCVATNTVANCGACGMACMTNETCTNNQCTCPTGTCQPQVVYDNSGTATPGALWVDGGYLYVSERTTSAITVRRTPVAGGAITLVATLGATSYNIAVANGKVLFTGQANPSGGTTTQEEYLYLVSGTGGTPSKIDTAYYTRVNSTPVGLDATYAYWFTWVTVTTVEGAVTTPITLLRLNLSGGGRTTLATPTSLPSKGIFVQGTGLYFAVDHGTSYELQSAVGTNGVTSIGTGSGTLQAMFVDSAGIYISDQLQTTAATKRIVRMNLDGTGPVPLSSDRSTSLATDATNVYYVQIDATPKSIFRVAKTGATPSALFYAPPAGVGSMTVADGYVYFTANNQVQRLATSYTP